MSEQIKPQINPALSIFTIPEIRQGDASLRVAAYCRVSTSSEAQLESIHAQKEHCSLLCSLHPNWHLTDIYMEEGLSGTSMTRRPELGRLIRDCKAGRIDLIVTKSISRLARSTTDCLEITRMLTGIGVNVFFEKEGILTGTAESELMLAILASLAEDESHSISDNNKWNCRSRFSRGTFRFSNAPYGYLLKDGQMIPHPKEAAVIRTIFDMARDGYSCCSIANELTLRNTPRRKSSGKWDSSYISKILRNPIYKGCVLHQKTYTDERFRTRPNHGEEDRYFISGHHAPIIEEVAFDEVQKLLDRGRKSAKKPPGSGIALIPKTSEKGNLINTSPASTCQTGNLTSASSAPTCLKGKLTSASSASTCLKGKLVCACGSSYRRVAGGKNRNRYSWGCGRHMQNARDCPAPRLPEESIKNAFTTMLNKLSFSAEKLLIPYIDALEEEALKTDEELLLIRDECERIRSELEKITELWIRGSVHPSVYYSKKNELSNRLLSASRAETGCQNESRKLAEAKRLLDYLKKRREDKEFDGAAFATYVERVHITPERKAAALSFQLTCGLTLREVVRKEKNR